MMHSFFDVLYTKQHFTQPFTCPCGDTDPNQMYKHCLTLSQKIATVVVSLFLAISTHIILGVAAFYILTATIKARNSVWTLYTSESYDRSRYAIFIPEWWGISNPSRIYVVNQDFRRERYDAGPPQATHVTHPHHYRVSETRTYTSLSPTSHTSRNNVSARSVNQQTSHTSRNNVFARSINQQTSYTSRDNVSARSVNQQTRDMERQVPGSRRT